VGDPGARIEVNFNTRGFVMDNDFDYIVDLGAVAITRYRGAGGAVVVPAEIAGLPVFSIGKNAFKGKTDLVSVVLPPRVSILGNRAFSDCTSLIDVTFGSWLSLIGNYAFYGCSDLHGITLPDRLTSIGHYAFSGCTGLTSVTLPDSGFPRGIGVFAGCRGLPSVVQTTGVTLIGKHEFPGMTTSSAVAWHDNHQT